MTPDQKTARWIENFCVVPFGFNRGQHVRLTTEQKEILRKLFDTVETPGKIAAPLSSYLALLVVAGPRALADRISPIELGADIFSTWNAVGPVLKSVLRRDGDQIVCPEQGTRYPAAARIRTSTVGSTITIPPYQFRKELSFRSLDPKKNKKCWLTGRS